MKLKNIDLYIRKKSVWNLTNQTQWNIVRNNIHFSVRDYVKNANFQVVTSIYEELLSQIWLTNCFIRI